MSSDLSRRSLLLLGGAGTVVTLAACSASGPEPAASTSSAAPGTAGTPQQVASLADIPVGGAVSATLDGKPILVTQPTAGNVVAFSAICTHQGCTVAPGTDELDCPCHKSRYDLATGAVLGGPAPRPLDKVTVTLDGDAVLAG